MDMNCDEIRDELDRLVDGELPPARQAQLRAHLSGCPSCDAEVRAALDLRARLAALPRQVEPARELWPEIAARIATRHRVMRGPAWPRMVGIAAASGGIVLAALLALQPSGDAPSPVAVRDPVAVPVDPGLQLAAQSMLDAAELDGRTLTPETVATVRANLELIDQALREIALALELDPDNPQLQRQLLDTYRGQADLLDYIGRASADPSMRSDL